MSHIAIVLPVRPHNSKAIDRIKSILSDTSFTWILFSKETTFTTSIAIEQRPKHSYRAMLNGIKYLLKVDPDNHSLQAEYQKYLLMDRDDVATDINISFEADIAADIDISTNSIMYYDGPTDPEILRKGMDFVKQYIVHDFFDECYELHIKKLLICIAASLALANPDIHFGFGEMTFYADGQSYGSDKFLSSGMQEEAYEKHKDLMTSQLTFSQAFAWIKQRVDAGNEKDRAFIAISALTYLLNREDHESLLYSIVGLESIFSPNSHGVSFALQRRLNCVFPTITQQQIKDMYKKRSDFVHGNVTVSLYHDYSDAINGHIPFDESALLASALLFETIRRMIANNATQIAFSEQISYQYN